MRAIQAILLAAASAASLHARTASSETVSVAPAPESVAARVKSLTPEQIQQALSAIQQRHVGAASIDAAELSRATLLGLLERLQPGAELNGGDLQEPKVVPFQSEILEDRVGYVRLGSLRTENIAQLDAALDSFGDGKTDGIVLDLRATPESRDFALAAEIAGRFVPAATTLFSMQGRTDAAGKPFISSEPLYRGLLVVLVDSSTRGAAEVIAAVLRRHAHAMLVGATTGGRAVEFESLPLGEGQQLRLAVAEARVEGLPPIYPDGLSPDLSVSQDPALRDAVLAASTGKGVAAFVFEHGRAQMNEAALVAGTNPELDNGDATLEEGSLFDRPLQRAIDLIVAIRLFRGKD
ncbi:MAG: hypothetical protein IAE97_10120 [Chthoniobacterales bacterium]|nr:hypothetical protein [Chthoniobacterales bacterium]